MAGTITAVETEPLQKMQYPYPVVGIEELHLWHRRPPASYYPAWYGGWYGPGWGWYGPGWGWGWYETGFEFPENEELFEHHEFGEGREFHENHEPFEHHESGEEREFHEH